MGNVTKVGVGAVALLVCVLGFKAACGGTQVVPDPVDGSGEGSGDVVVPDVDSDVVDTDVTDGSGDGSADVVVPDSVDGPVAVCDPSVDPVCLLGVDSVVVATLQVCDDVVLTHVVASEELSVFGNLDGVSVYACANYRPENSAGVNDTLLVFADDSSVFAVSVATRFESSALAAASFGTAWVAVPETASAGECVNASEAVRSVFADSFECPLASGVRAVAARSVNASVDSSAVVVNYVDVTRMSVFARAIAK